MDNLPPAYQSCYICVESRRPYYLAKNLWYALYSCASKKNTKKKNNNKKTRYFIVRLAKTCPVEGDDGSCRYFFSLICILPKQLL